MCVQILLMGVQLDPGGTIMKNKRLSIRVSEDLFHQFTNVVEDLKISKSEVVCDLILLWLQEQKATLREGGLSADPKR